MIDIIALLKTHIYSNWTESDPPQADLKFTEKKLGFNPVNPSIQILIDELPYQKIEKRFISTDLYAIRHPVLITVYLRLPNPSDASVTTFQTRLRNMLTEIDRLLNSGKFIVNSIKSVDLTSWEETTDRDEDPIVFVAVQVVWCNYYSDSTFTQTKFPFIFLS
jgi:hypothetical protein